MGNFFFPVEQHFWDCVFLRGREKKIGNITYLLTWHRRVLSFTFSFYLWIKAKGSLKTKMLPLGSLLWMETIYPIIWSNMCHKYRLRSEVVVLLFCEHEKSIDFFYTSNTYLESNNYPTFIFYHYILTFEEKHLKELSPTLWV